MSRLYYGQIRRVHGDPGDLDGCMFNVNPEDTDERHEVRGDCILDRSVSGRQGWWRHQGSYVDVYASAKDRIAAQAEIRAEAFAVAPKSSFRALQQEGLA